jgi:predicted RNase H-like nuclease (RuvC/YqgF family)
MERKRMNEKTKPLIIGFDILPQKSPSSRRQPRYAMAISQGETLETNTSVRRTDLLKKIRQNKPDILATDNLLELASTEQGVINFLSKLPSKTRILQVTGSPVHGMMSISKLARRHGLTMNRHPSPIETAIIITQLASLGIGTEISALTRETRIVISRARNIGPGGFSQARFQRRMHGAIQQVARSIMEKLTKAQMDYDQYETHTSHGWSRCVLHVYDSFDNITKIVQAEINRIAGVAVRISPIKHRTILYHQRKDKRDQVSSRRLLVVGVDAGTTVGIAIADVWGHVIAVHSERGLSRGDVIRYLVEYGKPILITADVSPAPSFIEKLSTSLKTPLFVPEKLLSVVEKRELAKSLTQDSELQPQNAHQRDALAAIANALRVHNPRLTLLQNRIAESDKQHKMTEALRVILQGGTVHDAIDQSVIIEEPLRNESPPVEPPKPAEKLSTIDGLQKSISQLQRQVVSLQRQLEFEKSQLLQTDESYKQMEKEYRQTQQQLNRVLNLEKYELRRDELVQRKNAEITRLRKTIEITNNKLQDAQKTISNLKLMRQLENRGRVQPILVLSHFTQEEIRWLITRYSKKKRKIVLIQDSSGGGSSTAEQLIQSGVQIIIKTGTMSHLALDQFTSSHIPVLEASKLRITMVDEFAVVDIAQLQEEIEKWQEIHKDTEREQAADALERLIEEYRQERRNEESKRK